MNTTSAKPDPGVGSLSEITCVSGDVFCVSGSDSQMRPGRFQGVYIRDTRVLSQLSLRIDGEQPPLLHGRAVGSRSARFAFYKVVDPDHEVDPRLVIERRRVVSDSLSEEIVITNFGASATTLVLELEASTDFAYIFDVKHGRALPPATASAVPEGVDLSDGTRTTFVRTDPMPDAGEAPIMRWHLELEPKQEWSMQLVIGYRGSSETRWPNAFWSNEISNATDEIPRQWR